MTPHELRSARKQLGLSQAGMSMLLRLPPKNGALQVRRMEAGTRPIRPQAEALILAALSSAKARETLGVARIARRHRWAQAGRPPA